MVNEKSCGAIVFSYENGIRKYVITRGTGIYKEFCGFPKGHMEPGETETETALREVKEETGLDVSVRRLIGVYTDPDIIYPNGDQAQSIVIAYELRTVSGELFCDRDETLELKYFSKEEKPQLFTGSHEELWNDIFNRT